MSGRPADAAESKMSQASKLSQSSSKRDTSAAQGGDGSAGSSSGGGSGAGSGGGGGAAQSLELHLDAPSSQVKDVLLEFFFVVFIGLFTQ